MDLIQKIFGHLSSKHEQLKDDLRLAFAGHHWLRFAHTIIESHHAYVNVFREELRRISLPEKVGDVIAHVVALGVIILGVLLIGKIID